jgi:hypothetical protein
VHHSWARDPEEIRLKLNSWGHNSDFNAESYLKLWNATDENNYKYMHNFHPLGPNFWKSMEYAKASNINELIDFMKAKYSSYKSIKQSFAVRILKNITPPVILRMIKKIIR